MGVWYLYGGSVLVRWKILAFFSLMLIAYIIIETEPQIGQFLQAALLLPAGKRPQKAKKPDCVPIWWLSGHITAKKSQIWRLPKWPEQLVGPYPLWARLGGVWL